MARYLDPKADLTIKELPPEIMENENIRMAAELCEESAFTPQQLATYEKYWDMVRTEKTAMKSALNKGRTEGRAEGRVETIEGIVVDCKKNGFTIEQIQLITKLTVEQMNEILKRHG